jgi:hypothetical protein
MNMHFVKSLIFILAVSAPSLNIWSRTHDYETTRLKSTGGTGVAAILLEESAVLNPAPIAFYNESSLYIQKVNSEYAESDKYNTSEYSESNSIHSVIVSDAKGSLKGSLAYHRQEEGADRRERISASMAKPFNKTSALGFNIRKTKDINNIDDVLVEEDYIQSSVGVIHSMGNGLSFGAVLHDPLKEVAEDNRFRIGAQYLYRKFITLMFDIGSDYNQDLSERSFYSGAIQMNLFKDFYARAGTFNDKYLKEKGNGIGVSWVSPKMSFELAFKNTNPFAQSSSSIQYVSKVRETSFSLAYLF